MHDLGLITGTSPPLVTAPRAKRASRRHGLDVFFAPETVAVIGAFDTPGSVGRTLLSNLVRHPFGGTIFPMEQTRIYSALKRGRGRPPSDIEALEQLLVRFSQLIVEQPWIKEIDINPLHASAEGLVALDARVVLHDLEVDEAALPMPAIRPYPTQYVAPWTLRDGTPVTIRPIRPEDEPLLRVHKLITSLTQGRLC